MNNSQILLEVDSISIGFRDADSSQIKEVVQNISFQLKKGETLAIVGESGSGKTVSTLASMGLLPVKNTVISSGKIVLNGKELPIHNGDLPMWQSIRGKQIAMVFQDPMSSLNPSIQCGEQIIEMMSTHGVEKDATSRKQKALELINEVQLPQPEVTFKKYPHELSGGQKQRVMIAMAIAANPQVIIADEPTTALDVTVQKSVLQLLQKLISERGAAMIFISHDLDVVKDVADKILVMYKGELVEIGSCDQIIGKPKHRYTKGLINCKPPHSGRPFPLPTIKDFMDDGSFESKEIKPSNSGKELVGLKSISKSYSTSKNIFGKTTSSFIAVNDVSFSIMEGETLGLVGESGCGKSTIGKLISGLIEPSNGSIHYLGNRINYTSRKEALEARKSIQMIFQDPFSSLNPRVQIGRAIQESMKLHRPEKSAQQLKLHTLSLLEEVGLSADDYNRYPHSFSGGQRQRIVIARTLAMEPRFIICDESVSALDVSVQAQVLNLLNELKQTRNLTYLFISHDLGVVRYMSDRILVMKNGEIIESGPADEVFNEPSHNYTKELISSIPGKSITTN
ncbi:MAG: ABC transporter ATP-binding protein [Flavobacteriales bacterium]